MNELDHDLFHRKSKKKNVKRLQQLAIQAKQSKRYPKLVLSAAYASYLFPSVLKEWQNGSTIGPDVKVEGLEDDIPFGFLTQSVMKSQKKLCARFLIVHTT